MQKPSVYQSKPAECPMIYALNIIGGKWKLPILWELSNNGTLRFNELKRSVSGITNTMLTQCLQELESSGLVKRVQYMEIPPRVEYSLTETGKSLIPSLQALQEWARELIKLQNEGQA